jgi:hypothetical protein
MVPALAYVLAIAAGMVLPAIPLAIGLLLPTWRVVDAVLELGAGVFGVWMASLTLSWFGIHIGWVW